MGMSGIFRPVGAAFGAESERSRGVPIHNPLIAPNIQLPTPSSKRHTLSLLIASLRITFPLAPAALVSCVNLIGFGQEVCSRLNTWVEFHGRLVLAKTALYGTDFEFSPEE
jgi:hypothetical protein